MNVMLSGFDVIKGLRYQIVILFPQPFIVICAMGVVIASGVLD